MDDFVPITNMEVVFLPTDSVECVDVAILDDDLLEDPETLTVAITPTDSNLLNVFRNQANITIISENSEFKQFSKYKYKIGSREFKCHYAYFSRCDDWNRESGVFLTRRIHP